MKIMYVSNQLDVYDRKFADKFVEYGYDICWITCNADKNKLNYFRQIYNEKFNFINIRTVLDTNFFEKINTLLKGKIINQIKEFFYVRELKKIINIVKPDILHGGWTMFEGYYCAKTNFHPFILMPWGTDILIYPFQSIKNFKRIRYAIKQADMITCDCEYQKEYVCKIGQYPEDKVITFPWGIDLDIFKPVKDDSIRKKLGCEDKIILICTRNFSEVYGHKYLFEAFFNLQNKYDDLRLLLIGDGELRNYFENLVDKENMADKCYFSGKVSQKEMNVFLNNSNIYVNLSLSDGVACSMLEAMAVGLSVITTDIPVNYEWIINGTNGFIVKRRNSKELEIALETLITNKELRKKMSEENIKIVKTKADWNKNFQKLNKIYFELESKNDNNNRLWIR